MQDLSALFNKYKQRLIAPESSVIDAFVEVVKDLWKIDLPKTSVRYNPSARILSLVGAGPLKSELKMREAEVIAHLRGRLGDKSAPRQIV